MIWIAVCWYNPRGEFGPTSAPIAARVGHGVSNLSMMKMGA